MDSILWALADTPVTGLSGDRPWAEFKVSKLTLELSSAILPAFVCTMLGYEAWGPVKQIEQGVDIFSSFAHLIFFALLGGFILSKDGRDENAVLSIPNATSVRSFCGGRSHLEERSSYKVNFVGKRKVKVAF